MSAVRREPGTPGVKARVYADLRRLGVIRSDNRQQAGRHAALGVPT
ncbi:hypothetical protein ACFYOD_36600 [Streptomyces sp. NPDC006703]